MHHPPNIRYLKCICLPGCDSAFFSVRLIFLKPGVSGPVQRRDLHPFLQLLQETHTKTLSDSRAFQRKAIGTISISGQISYTCQHCLYCRNGVALRRIYFVGLLSVTLTISLNF